MGDHTIGGGAGEPGTGNIYIHTQCISMINIYIYIYAQRPQMALPFGHFRRLMRVEADDFYVYIYIYTVHIHLYTYIYIYKNIHIYIFIYIY